MATQYRAKFGKAVQYKVHLFVSCIPVSNPNDIPSVQCLSHSVCCEIM